MDTAAAKTMAHMTGCRENRTDCSSGCLMYFDRIRLSTAMMQISSFHLPD